MIFNPLLQFMVIPGILLMVGLIAIFIKRKITDRTPNTFIYQQILDSGCEADVRYIYEANIQYMTLDLKNKIYQKACRFRGSPQRIEWMQS